MTDRTAGSVHLMADGPSGSSTLDTGETDTVDTDTTDPGTDPGTGPGIDPNTGTSAGGSADGGTESGTEISAVNGTAESVGVTDTNDAKPAEVTAETVALDPAADVADTIVDHEVPEAPSVDGKSAEATAETTVVPATDTIDAASAAGSDEEAPRHDRPADVAAGTREFEAEEAEPPRRVGDVTQGTRFAGRYRLEDKLSSNGKSATWRAVDEKLRRAVGIHLVAAGSEHARSVMAAARAAALVGDPRFVQVLDAAEEDGLVYVVKEWLPDADNLASLLATNPLPPHEAYEMARSVSDAMAVAHRAGLSHLRLDPENVLRMHTGQYKIVGLSVEAALYGHDTTDAARDDTRAIGSLLYACLARRWPDAAAYGLPQAPRNGDKLCTPGQVKAHVHMPLEAIAMRALGQEYKHQAPFEAPEDVVAALAAIPTVLPPEPEPPVSAAGAEFDDEYTPTALLSRGSSGFNGGPPRAVPTRTPAGPPPTLGGGFGRFVKGIVALIVLAAIVLATWQIAAHVNQDKNEQPTPSPTTSSDKPSPTSEEPPAAAPPVPVTVVGAREFDPYGGGQDAAQVKATYDNDPSTEWHTKSYLDQRLTDLKPGVGIVYDFGQPVDLSSVTVDLKYGGPGTTFEVRATAPDIQAMPPNQQGAQGQYAVVGTGTSSSGNSVTVTTTQPVKTRFVLIWFTELPRMGADGSSGAGLKNGVTEIHFNK
ncbi:protein kinase family protein [Streptomycetaceae bacterium NBC_01309]